MYRSKKFGVTNCKEENDILAKLERDLTKARKRKHKSARHKQGKKPDSQ